MRRLFSLVLMLAVVIGSQYLIARDKVDVVVRYEHLAGNPVDHYEAVGTPQGVVVVAHGFGGSKELMQYWGYAFARQGLNAYLVDQPGHGQQRVGMPAGERLEGNPLGENLRAIVSELVQAGRAEPGKIALVGHSMGGAAVVAAGMTESVAAVVTLSAIHQDPLPEGLPINLLSVVAEGDLTSILSVAPSLSQVREHQTITIADRNHLTILYDQRAVEAAVAWIHEALGTEERGPVDLRFPWVWVLVALLGGGGALFTVAAMMRPQERRSSSRSKPMGFTTGLTALSVALLSAVLVAVYLRVPQIGIGVLDYLLPYFLVASLLLLLMRVFWPREFDFPLSHGSQGLGLALVAGLVLGLVYLATLVPVVHMNLTHYLPVSERLLPLAAAVIVLWLYAVQEEGLKRAVSGEGGPLVGLVLGVMAKLVMVATWIGASTLPNPPTFLNLVVPVALVLLVGLELLGVVLRSLRQPPAAIATLNALVVAWTLVTTLPLT